MAVGVIAIAVILSIGIFIAVFRSTEKSGDRGTGSVVAASVMTEEVYSILAGTHPTMSKAFFFANDSPPQPPLQGTVNLNGTIYTYNIAYQTLLDTGGATLGSGMANNRTKKADITVWWWTPNESTQRYGYGFLRTHLTRLVNEKQEF